MARLLLIGAAKEEADQSLGSARLAFARAVGYQAVKRGHTIAGGCRTTLDRAAAEGAAEAATEQGLDPDTVIRSWISGSTEPVHEFGEVIRSQLVDWYRIPHGLSFPEAVRDSDVVMVVGGGDGTLAGATWSRFAGKPLVPVAALGLAAESVFEIELSRFQREYAARMGLDEYHTLNRYLTRYGDEEIADFAADIVSLAARLVTPTDVFVVMAFDDSPHLVDAYDTFQQVCDHYGLKAKRVDENQESETRLIPAIVRAIQRAAFVIADVSVPSPNVYYELGYAQALGKRVLVTAREGTELPFDIADVPTHFWSSQKELREKLDAQIRAARV